MKRLEGKDKKINYFGIELYIYHEVEYLTTDQDGEVTAHYDKPVCCHELYYWHSENEWHICNVDLEGMDWKETLMELK